MSKERTYGKAQWSLESVDVYGGSEDCCVDMAAHIRELLTENAALRADTALHIATQRAASKLPDGWEININIEKDAGWVILWGTKGHSIDFPDDGESLARSVNDAIDFAIQEDKS